MNQNLQTKVEESTKTSESLLDQILHRSILVRLNQGEKDISFTVESSVIMFIDIGNSLNTPLDCHRKKS